MFHFAAPVYLLLLLVLPLLAWWNLRQRRLAVPHPSVRLFAGLALGRAPFARYGGLVLRLLALTCIALALAGPRWPDLRTRLDAEGIALMMVVDASGSMAERDFDWNGEPISRLDAVKRVFRLFVAGTAGEPLPGGAGVHFEGRPTDLVGLVTFATRPEVACPLTLGHSTLFRQLDVELPRAVPGESETNLSDAVILALARLRAAGTRRKVLVLLTDGEHNLPKTISGWTPRQTSQIAVSLGVPIYTIDAGNDRPMPDGDGSAATRAQAVQTLRELADVTGGQYFAASDTAALVTACRSIDRLERTTIASFQYRRYHEAYPWLALAAFVFFVLALALERTMWRRLP
jgi:Ca-activated chloride channel family protein